MRRSFPKLLALLLTALLGACQSRAAPAPRPETRAPASASRADAEAPPPRTEMEPGDAAHGKALVAELQCNRCHAGTGQPNAPLSQDCVGCHERIATDEFPATASKLAKWKPHVLPYRDVPSLADLGKRLRPAWVRDYLLHPHDLRPHLIQDMPRLALSGEQARDIATYLTAGNAKASPTRVSRAPSHVARGKELLTERGCIACHRVGGAGLAEPPRLVPSPRTVALAPDLRFVRERSEPEAIARWLTDPAAVKPDAVMPNLHLSSDDVRDLTAFLSFGELAPAVPLAPAPRLPALSRRVGFDEVNERVFSVTCRHCHTNPDSAGGDGGPGNTGGFGFKPRKIDFSSYQGIQSGAVDAKGERVSLFAPTKEGVPRLVAALLARGHEVRGTESEDVRGMPLGLPPLSPEQLQLVESWVAQGRPL
jgi:cytochrome c5/cbb3-type cytochrome oxidase cytochrome c subunit